MRIVGHSDTAFANYDDLSSQLGRIIFLVDDDGNAAPIAFKSYKPYLVTCSVLASEAIAFADLFEEELALKDTIGIAIANSVQLRLLTDYKKSI